MTYHHDTAIRKDETAFIVMRETEKRTQKCCYTKCLNFALL